jgi:hypothetical protein
MAVSEPVWSARVGYISADPARLQGPKTIVDLAADTYFEGPIDSGIFGGG